MDHFAHGSRDSRWTPPDQYGLVESQVYRSAFLTPASFDFINLLNLRTVVNLSQEVPVRAVLSFFQENNITLENVGLQVWTSMAFAPITQELIKEALQYVLDESRHPLLLMSSSGTHQVGVLVGCLRRQQGWNLASILDEFPVAASFCDVFSEQPDVIEECASHKHVSCSRDDLRFVRLRCGIRFHLPQCAATGRTQSVNRLSVQIQMNGATHNSRIPL